MPVTNEQLISKMELLGVTGYSTLGEFSNEELMHRLNVIEGILDGSGAPLTQQPDLEFSSMEAARGSRSHGQVAAVRASSRRNRSRK